MSKRRSHILIYNDSGGRVGGITLNEPCLWPPITKKRNGTDKPYCYSNCELRRIHSLALVVTDNFNWSYCDWIFIGGEGAVTAPTEAHDHPSTLLSFHLRVNECDGSGPSLGTLTDQSHCKSALCGVAATAFTALVIIHFRCTATIRHYESFKFSLLAINGTIAVQQGSKVFIGC